MTSCCTHNGLRPSWLKKKLVSGRDYAILHHRIRKKGLNTVCSEACCPNQAECYSSGTATFMIMGRICTRNCAFCAVTHGRPQKLDTDEPEKIAQAVKEMNLEYVVITSVTRDDLKDGGAGQFAGVIASVKSMNPDTRIEVLVPDFQGSTESIETVVKAGPDVFNHNIETVSRLYPKVRPQADYKRSLDIFVNVKQMVPGMVTKSGMMLGLGERDREIRQALDDLKASGCDILTLGQYLSPSPGHTPVAAYISPADFQAWEQYAMGITGFLGVAAGPFIRSSYRALDTYQRAKIILADV